MYEVVLPARMAEHPPVRLELCLGEEPTGLPPAAVPHREPDPLQALLLHLDVPRPRHIVPRAWRKTVFHDVHQLSYPTLGLSAGDLRSPAVGQPA